MLNEEVKRRVSFLVLYPTSLLEIPCSLFDIQHLPAFKTFQFLIKDTNRENLKPQTSNYELALSHSEIAVAYAVHLAPVLAWYCAFKTGSLMILIAKS